MYQASFSHFCFFLAMVQSTRSGRRWWWLLLIAVLAAGLFIYPWQGRVVPVYVLQAKPLAQDVVASGRLAAPVRTRIASEIVGVVTERPVQEGDHVQAGALLLRLNSAEWQAKLDESMAALRQLKEVRRPQADADLREARSAAAQAEREVQRRRTLLSQNAITRENAEQAEQAFSSAQARLEQARLTQQDLAADGAEERLLLARQAMAQAALARTQLLAPFAGQVIVRDVDVGDVVQPGTSLFELVPDQVAAEAVVPVDELFIGLLEVGQEASLVLDAFPQSAVAARISRIAPRVDPQRGSVDVHLAPGPLPAGVREDMTLSATLHTARREAALVLPHSALLQVQGNQAQVQRIRDGRVEQVPVQLGLKGLLTREIVGGLAAGDQVLAQPAKVGQKVQAQVQALPDDR